MVAVIPMLGGKELMVWQDPHTPSDGRDEEAKEAFAWVMAITDVCLSQTMQYSFTTY